METIDPHTPNTTSYRCTTCNSFLTPVVKGVASCLKCRNEEIKSKNKNIEPEEKKCSDNIMNIREFCKKHNIQTMPIRLDMKTTKKRLMDGTFKKDKILKTYDLKGKVGFNDLDNKELCEKRWKFYENGNPDDYNFLAWDTKDYRVIDIDCFLPDVVDGKENPIKTLLNSHPFKRSSSKEYGRHIIVRDNVPFGDKRSCHKFPTKYGEDAEGTAGVEYLKGQWAWSPMDAVVEQANNPVQVDTAIIDIAKELEATKKKKTKTRKTPSSGTPSSPPSPPTATSTGVKKYNLKLLREKLELQPPSYYAGVSKAVGVILRCASTQDEGVYQVLHDVLKREGSNYETGGEKWVREQWDKYDPAKHKDKYTFDWFQTRPDPSFTLLCNDEAIGRLFLALFKDDLVVQVNNKKEILGIFAWEKENHNTWSSNLKDSKGYTPFRNYVFEKIVNVIQPDYLKRAKERQEFLEQEIELLDDGKEKEEKEIQLRGNKEVTGFLPLLAQSKTYLKSTCKLKGFVAWIESMVLADTSLRKEIQFNLEPSTKHLFQFRNGAFNLKTGKLEERTKEMYITCNLYYDYSDTVDTGKVDKLETLLKQTLPNDEQREGFKRWRGLCLTGETKDQAFMLNIGYGAENGKTTNSIHFRNAFPIYCKEIGHDAFDKGKESAYNKVFSSLANTPVRLVYMEEWGAKEQDVDAIKKTINGKTLTVKPMYQCEIVMRTQFKLEASSNDDPNTSGRDNGFNRRGFQQTYESKFVDDKEDVDEAKHHYLKDKSVMDLCEDPAYALALFHMFKPYAEKYYDEGLGKLEFMKAKFKETVNENDEFHEFFQEYVIKKDDGKISKQELQAFQPLAEFELTEKEFKKLKKAFQLRGYKYDSQLREGGKKGFFVGCELVYPFI